MDATTFRRYLQRSPTLRWHPWAPAIAGTVLLGFTFMFGAMWGHAASERDWRKFVSQGKGTDVLMRMHGEVSYPAHALMNEAGKIDAGVHQYLLAVARESEQGRLATVRDRIERLVFGGVAFLPARDSIVRLAEFRLKELSPAHPRWAITGRVCEEMNTNWNVINAYGESAAEYTRLLGRPIRAEDLAPPVADGDCTVKRIKP